MTTSASEEQRIPSLWNAFEYVDKLATAAARDYALTDRQSSREEFWSYFSAANVILHAHNEMHEVTTHELPK